MKSFCGIDTTINEMDFKDYQEQASRYNLLDVRTELERDEFPIKSIHIPLNALFKRYTEIPRNKNILVFCKSGFRSKLAIKILQDLGFDQKLMNLKGGLSIETSNNDNKSEK